ncbi:MAG: HipA domain-containing protein [Clostridia bacterium]|nr:HipA domain-containing protein [Clostridia bacterium]
MICLCCGKEIPMKDSTTEEIKSCWHNRCIKKFFGTKILPDINISEEMLKQLAEESINKGFTVPGVQKKLSLHLTEENQPRLTLTNYPTGYILKPQTEDYQALPEAEYLVMKMAEKTGIKTVPFALIRINEQNDKLAYITRRIDRVKRKKKGKTDLLAMEDFCQLDGRLTQDKYRGSYERCAKIIKHYSEFPGLDLSELFLRIVFSFVAGNSDMHLKNFSLIETAAGSGRYKLSDAYDMLPVNIILPKDKEQTALTINGKKQNIRKKDFIIFAETAGIPQKTAKMLIGKVVSLQTNYLEMCRNSFLPQNMKESLEKLISERIYTIT